MRLLCLAGCYLIVVCRSSTCFDQSSHTSQSVIFTLTSTSCHVFASLLRWNTCTLCDLEVLFSKIQVQFDVRFDSCCHSSLAWHVRHHQTRALHHDPLFAPRMQLCHNPASQECCVVVGKRRCAETQDVDSAALASKMQRHTTTSDTDFVAETLLDGPSVRPCQPPWAGAPHAMPCSLVPCSLVHETECSDWAAAGPACAEDIVSGVLCEHETSDSGYASSGSTSNSDNVAQLDCCAASMPCSAPAIQPVPDDSMEEAGYDSHLAQGDGLSPSVHSGK